MPWMIFYQQGAVIDKKLTAGTIRKARHDTATGAPHPADHDRGG